MNLYKLLRISLFLLLLPLLLSLESRVRPVLAQVGNPSFSKSFSPSTIGSGSVSTLTFNIFNEDPDSTAQDMAFTDTLPAGVVIATPANATSTCGGTLTAPDGGDTIAFIDGTLATSSGCTVSVDVTSSIFATHMNVSGDLTSNFGNSGNAAADLIVDSDRPGFSKSFAPSSISFGGRSTLIFTIDNSANESFAVNLAFTDDLSPGLVVAGPANVSNTCTGLGFPGSGVTAVPGTSTISLSAGGSAVDGVSTCTISVDVTATGAGFLANSTGELTSSAGGPLVSSGKANALLEVTTDPLSLIKSFTDDPVPAGGTTLLQFTITNFDREDSASNITFTDNLNAALSGLTAVGLPLNNPCGSGSQLTGTSLLTLNGGNLAPEASCIFTITLQVPGAAVTGSYTNTTSSITGDVGGAGETGSAASDILFVEPAPILSKEFVDDPVATGGSVTMRFSITNTSLISDATDIAFLDELTTFFPFPISVTLPSGGFCGPGAMISLISLGVGGQGLSMTGGSLAPSDSCVFDVILDVPVGVAANTYINTTENITAIIDGQTVTGNPASGSFVVVGGPTLQKEFTDDPVEPGDTVTLEFTLTHDPNAPGDATNISFTDDLGTVLPGLTATGLPQNDVCGAGSQISGTTLLSFSGGSLAPGVSCAFSITLQVPSDALPGDYTNTTGNVNSTVLGLAATGNVAQNDLTIAGLALTKAFTDDPVIPGDTVTLEFTLDNTISPVTATNISFTDDLDDTLNNMVATGLPLNNICGAGSSLTGAAGNTLLVFNGGSLAAGASCTFSVTLQVPANAADGVYNNVTSVLLADIDGSPAVISPATDQLSVASDFILFSKAFIDDPVLPGGTATLAFSMTNQHQTEVVTGISFTDDLDAALAGLSATGLPPANICGSGSQISGTSLLTFTGGSLAPGETCSFTVTVQVPPGIPPGTSATNTTSEATGAIGGLPVRGDPATDVLQIDVLIFSKAFDGPSVAGGTPQLIFTIENVDATMGVSGISFQDDLDAVLPGLVVTGLPVTDICGSGSQLSGTSLLTFSEGQLGPGGSCTFTVTLQIPASTPAGSYLNVTSPLNQGGLASANPAAATLTIEPAPIFSKSFSPDSMMAGQVSTLNFIIDNTASALAASSLDFIDNLPAGVVVAAPPNASTTCAGGTLTAVAGTGTVAYSGGVVAAGASCTVQVDVTSGAAGVYVNTSGNLTSTSGTSGAASDTLTVTPAPDLTILKSVTPATAEPGQAITYTLAFSNAGGAPGRSVIITDIVPASVVSTSVASSGATITETTPGYVWAVQDLTPGEGGMITISGVLTTSLSPGVLTNTATIAGADDFPLPNNSSSAAVTIVSPPPPPPTSSLVYLPLVLKDVVFGPDLVIETLLASSNQVTLTIRNIGNAPAIDAFWVQIAINPSSPITDVNQRWDTLGNSGGGSPQGALWGVVSPAIPLPVNATLTLTLNGPYYYSGSPANNIPSPIPAGATIYAQVDAINYATTYGNVPELDETNNISNATATAAIWVVEPAAVDITSSNPPDASLPGLMDEAKE